MSTFSVGGLSSGLDTKSIVTQLLQIDARPKVRKEWSRQLWESRKAIWTEVNTKLLALQGRSNALTSSATWNGGLTTTSSDPGRVRGTLSGPGAVAGTHALEVSRLATDERWDAAASVSGGGVGGSRQSGTWWAGAFTEAGAGTRLVDLAEVDGTKLGLTAGSTISLSASVNGSPVTGSFSVTDASTLDDLVQWAESQFPGATFSVGADGTVVYQSAAGASNEITSLTFSATDAGGSSVAMFDASEGAQSTFASAPSGGGSVADTLSITQGSTTWNVSIAAGSDDATIAAAINGTPGIGISASVVDGRLRLQAAADSGGGGAFTVTSAGSLASDLGLARTTAGQDAQFTVDGTAYTRSRNAGISDVLTGVSLDLLGTTTSPVTLTIGAGTGSAADIKKKVQDFVAAYNDVVDFIKARTSEQRVASPKNLADFVKAPLGRDYGLSSVAFELRRWTTDTISGLPDGGNALDDIGVTTGAVSSGFDPGNVSGRLVIDEAKLDAALASDPTKVRDVFAKVGTADGRADDGIAWRIGSLVSELRTGGRVDSALSGASRQIRDLQSSIDRMEDRLAQRRTYYERMFSNLETTLGRMQSQGNWLSGQLSALMNGSSRA